ncbi:MAG TPA: hypothetical protein DER09_08650 [Prolixibacteraceae bacterium]|nr:hypothetical protein [Prolixibacteraceae bacterium]
MNSVVIKWCKIAIKVANISVNLKLLFDLFTCCPDNYRDATACGSLFAIHLLTSRQLVNIALVQQLLSR